MSHYTHFMMNYLSKLGIILIFLQRYYTYMISDQPYHTVINIYDKIDESLAQKVFNQTLIF